MIETKRKFDEKSEKFIGKNQMIVHYFRSDLSLDFALKYFLYWRRNEVTRKKKGLSDYVKQAIYSLQPKMFKTYDYSLKKELLLMLPNILYHFTIFSRARLQKNHID